MGYEVVIEDIRQMSQAAERVAAAVGEARCAAAIAGGDAGMPGARAVAKLAQVTQLLATREQQFVTDLRALAADGDKAADLYLGNEETARHELAERTTGGPRPS